MVINEINYNSSDDFNPGDWVELFNEGGLDLDMSGWVFKDDNEVVDLASKFSYMCS